MVVNYLTLEEGQNTIGRATCRRSQVDDFQKTVEMQDRIKSRVKSQLIQSRIQSQILQDKSSHFSYMKMREKANTLLFKNKYPWYIHFIHSPQLSLKKTVSAYHVLGTSGELLDYLDPCSVPYLRHGLRSSLNE